MDLGTAKVWLLAAAVVLPLAGCAGGDDTAGTLPRVEGQRRIVTLSRNGSLACGGGPGAPAASFSLKDGDFYTALLADLLDPQKFGPQGVVPTTLAFLPSIDLIRDRSVRNADILVVNRPKLPLDGAALDAIRKLVLAGGSVISLGDDGLPLLGATGPCAADTTADVTEAGRGSPLVDGPFGSVGDHYTTGYNCAFQDLAPGAIAVSSNDAGPNLLTLDMAQTTPGAGRMVSFADEEMFSSLAVTGCASALLTTGSANQRLALNAFAFLAQ